MVNFVVYGFLGLMKYSMSRISFTPKKTLESGWEFEKDKFTFQERATTADIDET